jgi:3-deoxy-D-manno-octulosonic-acid transferase/heptosyltransferase-1
MIARAAAETASTAAPPPGAILVIRLGAVGDVVRTLPAVSCLRRSFPGARIAWAVEEPSREILEGHPDLDEVLVLRRRALVAGMRLGGTAAAAAHLRALAAALRGRGFDWAVDFHGTLKSAILARLSAAPRRIGFGRGHAREMSHLLYTDVAPLPRGRAGRIPRAARALALARHAGADTSDPRRLLPVREEAAASVRRFLEAEAPGRPRVLVAPGTSAAQAYKRYPVPLLARLADRIAEGSGASVILAWGPGERAAAEEVLARMARRGILAPPTSLTELAELARSCDLFVGSDSGPLHLAAAAGAPVVALYGPTDPLVNAPYAVRPHLAFVGDVACRPCRLRGCLNRSCLRLIDPDEVAREARALLA